MIVVKIEMWPRGDEARAHEIGRMYIANDGGSALEDEHEVWDRIQDLLEDAGIEAIIGIDYLGTEDGYYRFDVVPPWGTRKLNIDLPVDERNPILIGGTEYYRAHAVGVLKGMKP